MDVFLLMVIALSAATLDKALGAGTIPCDSDGWLHRCDDGSCILDTTLCDGVYDCPDGSDEKPYHPSFDGFECTVKSTLQKCLLPESAVCDQYSHCLEDECNCAHTYPFRCSPDECVNLNYFCDGLVDCHNGEDELIYSNKSDGILCTTGYNKTACALPLEYKCDGTKNCLTGGDECFCGAEDGSAFFSSTCFRCLDGNGEMLLPHVCNGFVDCPDLSDECLCENPISLCKQLAYEDDCEFRCKPSKSYPRDNRCILKSQICDGERNCPLGEDEKFCPFVLTQKELIQHHYKEEMPEFWCCNAGYPADCLYEDTFTNDTYDGCDKFYACPPDANYFPYLNYAIKCDGVPTCTGFYDECLDCPGSESQPYCAAEKRYGFVCPDDVLTTPLFVSDICDGEAQCNATLQEESADELNCQGRFYCLADIDGAEHVSIPISSVCDCITDCRDGSDESNCTEYSNFCCRNGEGVTPKSGVCNGVEECSDGSDECQSCIESPFADDKHLISNKALRAFVWIIGILSSSGNIYVLARTRQTACKGKLNEYGKITSYHVAAVAVADLCVGLYLIGLGVADTVYAEIYCYEEKLWRSSDYCNLLGVLSTFGLQASVFLLTAMTLNRLRIVFRPFKRPCPEYSLIYIIILYILALMLAIIPVLPPAEDYFKSHVRFHSNPFARREVNRAELSAIANKMTSYNSLNQNFNDILGGKQEIYPWKSLFNLMQHLNESFESQYEFGYYSSHGVCLPKLFPTRDDPTWQYSIALIVINFISFVTVLISYICLYRRAIRTRKKANVNPNESQQTTAIQRKITRIIVTDFCCWMPICIIAFLKISGVPISNVVYAVAAIVILPINSAINPFLYSNLPEAIWSRAGKAYNRISPDTTGGNSRETDMTPVEMKGRYIPSTADNGYASRFSSEQKTLR